MEDERTYELPMSQMGLLREGGKSQRKRINELLAMLESVNESREKRDRQFLISYVN